MENNIFNDGTLMLFQAVHEPLDPIAVNSTPMKEVSTDGEGSFDQLKHEKSLNAS